MGNDMTDIFSTLRGDAFVEAVRALAILSTLKQAHIRCGGCGAPAEYIGMQRCGTPGGPVCQGCLEVHRAYVDVALMIEDAQPCCRHCGSDVDRNHVYAVNLWDGTEVVV